MAWDVPSLLASRMASKDGLRCSDMAEGYEGCCCDKGDGDAVDGVVVDDCAAADAVEGLHDLTIRGLG